MGFHVEVVGRSRYVRSKRAEQFIAAVRESSNGRVKEFSKGALLWRAQRGCDTRIAEEGHVKCQKEIPYCIERMKPRSDCATEGRVNPKGIPVLYLADDCNTALSEVRPWINEPISIAKFEAVRALRLADCSKHGDESDVPADWYDCPPEKIADRVWMTIDRMFATPVTASDVTAEYAPTQVLAEAFRAESFDGVAYKSSLAQGLNIALFDPSLAHCLEVRLTRTKRISYEFEDLSESRMGALVF